MLAEKECLLVSDEAKQSTKYCPKNFACLNGNPDLCKVEQCLGKEVLFVTCLQQGHCPYKIPFGFNGHICACPVRKEIYKKYGI